MTNMPPPASNFVPDTVDESTGTTARRWVWMLGGASLLVLIAVVVWITFGRRDSIRYTTEVATRGPLTVEVTATGTLQPVNQVEIGSEISGTIKSVLVDYNDTVKVGQVLARIDTTRLEAQVQQSRAALAAAAAKVVQAKATQTEADAQLKRLEHMHELTGGTVPSESDLDSARAALERAKADVASAEAMVQQSRATLDAQQTDLSKAVIRSPIDGVVLQRSVEPGQTVAASLQAPVLFVLAEDLRQIELHVDVDEADVSAVAAGQQATFTVDAFPDRKFPAQVVKVYFGPRTVSGVVTYETVLSVDNSALALRPGMTATANIVVQQVADTLRVPNAALRYAPESAAVEAPTSGGGLLGRLMPRMPRRGDTHRAPGASDVRRVWTLRGNEPVPLDVRVGVTDGVNTQILSGDLKPGTPLIVDSTAAST
ncbi:MAG TPA: efflux RND transporter periplasmic adaptor subunit [Steroidobacteraceae bacterium]|nr:efflux RND transporter periplasmic adaptor subunit [Steroidobacteraceae bacterium]